MTYEEFLKTRRISIFGWTTRKRRANAREKTRARRAAAFKREIAEEQAAKARRRTRTVKTGLAAMFGRP